MNLLQLDNILCVLFWLCSVAFEVRVCTEEASVGGVNLLENEHLCDICSFLAPG